MTSMPLSTRLRKKIAKEMATGLYRSPEAMMLEALDALAERRSALEGIRRGLEDMNAGHMRSWRQCKRDLLERKPYLADA
jgi:predicted transcriptional regulator